MAEIPFPQGLSGTENLPRTRKLLQNCFINSEGVPIYRPGILGLNTVENKQARGNFSFNNSLYMIFAQDLIKITDTTTGAFSFIGTIDGPEVVATAVGFNEVVIVGKGAVGSIYTLDKTETLVQIWSGVSQSGNANFESCVDVDHVDSRFVYTPASGEPVFLSDIGDAGSVQGFAFFDAETVPDRNVATDILNNRLHIFGTDTIEAYLNTGVGPVPFERSEGGSIDVGFIGGKLKSDQATFFIGRKKDQVPGIFALGLGVAPKISNEAIDLILSTYTLDELAEAIPGRIVWRGNDFASITLRDDSFGFIKGQWVLLDTVFDQSSRPWGAGFIAQFEGEYFTAFQDRIGKFTKVNTDYGERITRIIRFGIKQPSGKYFSVQSLELGVSQGFNPIAFPIVAFEQLFDDAPGNFDDLLGGFDAPQSVVPSSAGGIAIKVSDDNVLFSDPVFRKIGNLGQYKKKLIWDGPGGIGKFKGYMAIEIKTTEDIIFSSDTLIINASEGLQLA